MALSKNRQNGSKILACLGRTWYLRAKHDHDIKGFRTALDYSKQALEEAPTDVNFQFNVAFIQFQIAQAINVIPEQHRTLADVEDAAKGLMEAIEALERLAKEENPPFPRADITSRANMGRNTMAKQLDRAREKQATYEEENYSKLSEARKLREAEVARREEEKRRAIEEAAERKRKIIEEQERIAQRDRELMEQRSEEQRRRMEEDEDRELRKAERKARGPKGPKRKKKDADSDTEASDDDAEPRSRRRRTSASGTEGLSENERPREKKKRKLARKSEPAGKFKSAEFVDDDTDEDVDGPAGDTEKAEQREESGNDAVAAAPRARKGRVVDDEDEDEDGDGVTDGAPKVNGDAVMDEDDDE